MRCNRRQHLQPSAPWASIDIAEPGDEHVAHAAPEARILPSRTSPPVWSDVRVALSTGATAASTVGTP